MTSVDARWVVAFMENLLITMQLNSVGNLINEPVCLVPASVVAYNAISILIAGTEPFPTVVRIVAGHGLGNSVAERWPSRLACTRFATKPLFRLLGLEAAIAILTGLAHRYPPIEMALAVGQRAALARSKKDGVMSATVILFARPTVKTITCCDVIV